MHLNVTARYADAVAGMDGAVYGEPIQLMVPLNHEEME